MSNSDQIIRRSTRTVTVGNIKIGGNNPITVQSMTNTITSNVPATVDQIKKLEAAGCELVRVAVPDIESANAIEQIKKSINIPLIADIHFDYRLAVMAIERGADKLRINPGNIGGADRVAIVADKAKEYKIPIRVGVNAGSLEEDIRSEHGVTAQALVKSALRNTGLLESMSFDNIVISLKASDLPMCVNAYRMLSDELERRGTPYPLHIGITETGQAYSGIIKSSAGLGGLLLMGIGDTLRISLTDDPAEEIKCGKELLKALELRNFGPRIISCPTCGRTRIDIIGLTNRVAELCKDIDANIKIAVMGCEVNGPGEAREADIGVAGGKGSGIIFKDGKVLRKVSERELLNEFMNEIQKSYGCSGKP